jgi:hypothetical protein
MRASTSGGREITFIDGNFPDTSQTLGEIVDLDRFDTVATAHDSCEQTRTA